MDDALYFMLHGCDLARRLEPNLRTLQNLQPDDLSGSCQEIISVFTKALDCLNRQNLDQLGFGRLPENILQKEHEIRDAGATFQNELAVMINQVANVQDLDPLLHLKRSPVAAAEGSSSGKAGFLMTQGSKKRRGFSEKNTIRVPAPPIGNTEIIPDDGFTWRKYGQKAILGTRYPRGYYRCTHKTFYGCDAKKQVQRTDDDPYTYEITYCGTHTCQTPAHMVINPINTMESDRLEPSPRPVFGAGPQMPRAEGHAKSMEKLVFEYGDIIFNSGSSSTNSMDSIFSPNGNGGFTWRGGGGCRL